MTDSLTGIAPAKLNLFLHIIGRRDDGYHALESVFRFVDYGDTVTMRVRDDTRICRLYTMPDVPAEQDLCVRAARLLQQASGTRRGVDIQLVKRLPMGGGLGGGSSDAATVLMGLNRLWKLGWSRSQLQALALDLGADVPVFIFGASAFARGIGEQLQPIQLEPAWYLVMIPSVSVSTAQVFAHQGLTRDTKPIKMSDFIGLQSMYDSTHNDLQSVVCEKYPAVAQNLAWLSRYASARMTGSGACVFAQFKDKQSAMAVHGNIPRHLCGWVAQGLDLHPLYTWVHGD